MEKLPHIAMSAPDPWKAAEFCTLRRGGNGCEIEGQPRWARAPHPTPVPTSGEREGPAEREGEG